MSRPVRNRRSTVDGGEVLGGAGFGEVKARIVDGVTRTIVHAIGDVFHRYIVVATPHITIVSGITSSVSGCRIKGGS